MEEPKKEEKITVNIPIPKIKITKKQLGVIAIIVIFVLSSFMFMVLNSPLETTNPITGNYSDIENGEYVLGNPDAKVKIIEFSDFTCDFCKQAHDTMKQIITHYNDSISFSHRDFPVHPPLSIVSAQAVLCAGEQGKYWEFYDILFDNQSDWVDVGAIKFSDYVKLLNLSSTDFNKCLSSDSHVSYIENDFNTAVSLGLQGTPAFFINDKLIKGAQPYDIIKGIIDEELTI